MFEINPCFSDINECALFSNLCVNGVCEDLEGNYHCKCNQGFEMDNNGKGCRGKITIV